jgi:YVTN family beta-propeller protein
VRKLSVFADASIFDVMSPILGTLPATSNTSRRRTLFRVISYGFLAALLIQAAPSPAVTQLATISVGHKPGPIVTNPSAHLVYVVNQSANTVSVLDSEKLTVKKVIAVGSAPVAIAANPVANMVYVANSGSGTISAITNTKAAVTWTVGGKPIAVVVDSALNKLFVVDSSLNQVKILNSTTGALLATLSTSSRPTAVTLNIATHSVFVACTAGSVLVIDGNKNVILTTVNGIPAGVTSISVDPETNIVVVASPTAPYIGAIAVIDAGNGYTVEDIPGDSGAKPTATAYDAGGLFFVADNGDGNIYFAGGDGQFTLGNDYQTDLSEYTSLAVNPTTNQMGVLSTANTVYLIDLLNPLFPSVYHDLTTGNAPVGLAFDPLTSRLFVTNSGDNTVNVFDVSPHSMVPAYEGNFSNNDIDRNFLDINPATGTVYTLRLGNLYAINEAAAALGSTGLGGNSAGVTAIPVGSVYCTAVAANPATNKIYVGDNVGLFYSVNGATNTAKTLSVIPSTADIMSIAINSAADQVLAWDAASNDLFVLDSATDTLLKTIPLGSISPTGFVVADPAKGMAYVAAGSTLSFVDPTAGTVLSTVSLGKTSPLGVAFNAAAERLYVASNSTDLFVVDTNLKSLILDLKPPFPPLAVGVNPLTGNYYVAADDGGTGTAHVYIYNGTTNSLILDLSATTYPELARASDIEVNTLTNTVYVGKDDQASTGIAAIDGLTNVVSTVTPNTFDVAAHELGVDLGSSILAGAGYSYTSLWLPTSDTTNTQSVPIAVTIQGVRDLNTIATKPLFRTRNTQPSLKISATSNFSENASALVPKHGFYQVDGWQGTWTPVNLTAAAGAVISQAAVKLPVLSTGQHILYAYASTGDVATVQDSTTGANSPAISPVGFVVFTVEK